MNKPPSQQFHKCPTAEPAGHHPDNDYPKILDIFEDHLSRGNRGFIYQVCGCMTVRALEELAGEAVVRWTLDNGEQINEDVLKMIEDMLEAKRKMKRECKEWHLRHQDSNAI